MINPERQVVTDLIKKAQSVISSIDPEVIQGSYPVESDTAYLVNAHAIWELGTAIAIVERDLGISLEDEQS